MSNMDCEWITPKRTAGATAVAARQLARPSSNTVAVRDRAFRLTTNTKALSIIFRLHRLMACDVSTDVVPAFGKDVANPFDLEWCR